MDASAWFGLVGVAATLGALASAPFGKFRTRIFVAAFVAALALVPFLPERTSASERVFAFWDVPSTSTLFFVVYYCVFFRRSAEPNAPRPSSARALSPNFWRVVLILFGAALYASELNVVEFDVYRLGYSQIVALTATVAVVVAGARTAAALAAVAFVATSCGLYANFFDAILDFGCWVALVVWFLVDFVRTTFRKKNRAILDKNAPPA